jgi:hypothetical protein
MTPMRRVRNVKATKRMLVSLTRLQCTSKNRPRPKK